MYYLSFCEMDSTFYFTSGKEPSENASAIEGETFLCGEWSEWESFGGTGFQNQTRFRAAKTSYMAIRDFKAPFFLCFQRENGEEIPTGTVIKKGEIFYRYISKWYHEARGKDYVNICPNCSYSMPDRNGQGCRLRSYNKIG